VYKGECYMIYRMIVMYPLALILYPLSLQRLITIYGNNHHRQSSWQSYVIHRRRQRELFGFSRFNRLFHLYHIHIHTMSRSLSSLQPLRNIVSRQARPSSSVASRVLAARRTYSTEKEAPKEGEAKDENAEKIAGLESKIKELEVSLGLFKVMEIDLESPP
jgi:hypothetical protein